MFFYTIASRFLFGIYSTINSAHFKLMVKRHIEKCITEAIIVSNIVIRRCANNLPFFEATQSWCKLRERSPSQAYYPIVHHQATLGWLKSEIGYFEMCMCHLSQPSGLEGGKNAPDLTLFKKLPSIIHRLDSNSTY